MSTKAKRPSALAAWAPALPGDERQDGVVRRRPGTGAMGDRGAVDPDAQRAAVLRALEQANWVLAGPRGAATRLGIEAYDHEFEARQRFQGQLVSFTFVLPLGSLFEKLADLVM
jgi:hypothetical protein